MRIVEDDALRSLVWLPTLICNCFCGRVASPIVQRPSMRYSQQTACVREVAFAMFEFQIIETVEIFKDPIGHYHHWTILFGRLAEGTMYPRDLICIPAVQRSLAVVPYHGARGWLEWPYRATENHLN